MSTEGGRWSKKRQKLVNVVCERSRAKILYIALTLQYDLQKHFDVSENVNLDV